jgi:hypothetical protein
VTPFLQFRVWLRRGPNGERVVAGLALMVLVALVGWVVAGSSGDGRANLELAATPRTTPPVAGQQARITEAADVAPAAGVPGGAPAAGSPEGPGVEPAAVGAPGAGASAGPCAGSRATDQGVSATEIFVAVPVLNLWGEVGNETFNIRGDLGEVAEANAAAVNAEGGLACRKLRIKVYRVNPLDKNDQRAKCLEIIEAKPFAVIDIAGYLDPVSRACFPEARLPYLGATALTEEEAGAAFPFLFSMYSSNDRQLRNWVFETAARHTFDPRSGFLKLGLLMNECNPRANAELKRNLAKVGLRDDQISLFTLSGCASINSPGEIGQAVVQHHSDGVSHVFLAGNAANGQNYVRQADGSGWKPAYLASDYWLETNPSVAPDWPDGFDGALGITSTRSGERPSGIVHPLVDKCNEWLQKANVAPSETETDEFPIRVCDMFRLFVATANAAGPDLVRSALVEALAEVGRFDTGIVGDGVFDRPGKVFGGDFVRAILWHRDCTCWKVVDRDMTPGH